ncbi:MAG: hypothetical protein AAB657_00145 [Patescibacteria group bacterium]
MNQSNAKDIEKQAEKGLDLSTAVGKQILCSRILKNRFGTDGVIREGVPNESSKKTFSSLSYNHNSLPGINFADQLGLYYDELIQLGKEEEAFTLTFRFREGNIV